MKRALITGITGQDGFHLTELLQSKGYKIYGLLNGQRNSRVMEFSSKFPDVELLAGDLTDFSSLMRAIDLAKPNELYNLGAISFVGLSFKQPELTANVTGLGPLRLLEAIRTLGAEKEIKFYQASSSEMFGPTSTGMQSETTELNPKSPYAESKVEAHLLCNDFQSDGYKVRCGILFNHESIYRPTHFVTRKVTTAIARIKLGLQKELEIGNLEATRDWGSARDYVAAMHLILNSETPDDYVIATGKSHSVRDLISISLRHVDLEDSFEELVKVDTTLLRTGDVKKTIGDSRKIKNSLGWEATTSFSELIYEMIQHDLGLNTISD